MPSILRNKHHKTDPVWHVQIAMLIAIGFQLALPNQFSVGSSFVLPVIELLLIIALPITTPRQPVYKSLARRVNVIALLSLAGLGNIYSLGVVANELLKGGQVSNGRTLITAAINIYLTNLIIFALLYWEMDGGGPGERQQIAKYEQDFLFPQHQNEAYKHPEWKPTFTDYLYVSSTNAMAFSPTDTMPMSRRAKILMLAQATVSLIAVALVAARAVNILR
ncbi:MAG TPA: hypothetical protein VLF90_01685 [Patescibacteria group bacterium]|nr:hypothetical protein [Patescibacteria group bacterium]